MKKDDVWCRSCNQMVWWRRVGSSGYCKRPKKCEAWNGLPFPDKYRITKPRVRVKTSEKR